MRMADGRCGLLLAGSLALISGCVPLAVYTVGEAAGQECSKGQVACKDGCVAAGACDECADGQELCDGACVVAGACDEYGACPQGQVKCGAGCMAADTCPCDEGCDEFTEVCEAGRCVCRGGLARCGADCVDTRSDQEHCGECGDPCAGDGGVCQDGGCVAACAASLQECGGGCVDVGEDALHCGECDRPCESHELCLAGECREYGEYSGCAACPCPEACESGEGEEDEERVCCDSAFLGAPVCVEDGCG